MTVKKKIQKSKNQTETADVGTRSIAGRRAKQLIPFGHFLKLSHKVTMRKKIRNSKKQTENADVGTRSIAGRRAKQLFRFGHVLKFSH